MPSPQIGRLHVLTDVHFQHEHSHAEIAERACAGGADTIQFRDKGAALRDRLEALRDTMATCRAAHVTCLVNDDLALALATGADGVHLGQHDLPIADARHVLPRVARPARIVGATATTAEQAQAAEADGADYIGFGPVFPTRSKENPASVKGLDGLATTCAAVSIPVIAIAGITPERVALCLDAGAWGVAVMTAITTARNPIESTRAFRRQLDDWLAQQATR
ncbi:MAG: thiamine phosphate synthase [Rubricoccaceae bacterium]